MDDVVDALAGLTSRQRLGLQALIADVRRTPTWTWQLPVLIRQRCWLRLDQIRLSQLHRWLPPDTCAEAPELVRYRELLSQGWPALQAQECCWQEFGAEDCHQALQRFWASQSDGRQHWTMQRYLTLVDQYRRRFNAGNATIPMLELPRQGDPTDHQLHWVSDSTPMMRHTCA